MKKILGNAGVRRDMFLFFLFIAVVALANGFSDSVLSNYFKDAYNVTASQRAFIEFPRELPGMICVLVISLLSFIGDIKLSVIAQILACIGMMVLGLFTPSFGVMLIFLFISSLGMHLFMPLSDSIGMALAEPDKIGVRVGQYGSLKTAVGFVAGICVFVGFRSGFFSFKSDIKWIFVISALLFLIASFIGAALVKERNKNSTGDIKEKKKKFRLIFRKEYKYYYFLTVLHGVQKQIAFVFGSWVIIDLLMKGADIMSLLTIVGSFAGIFFFRFVGKWMDSKGIKFMMYLDAVSFIVVYVIYGTVVWLIAEHTIPSSGWPVIIVYALFILDRLSMQVGVVKSVYLRSIAVDKSEVTEVLSTGISLDHLVSIIAAQISGFIWMSFGAQWVFYFAALFSLGNLFIAWKIKDPSKDAA